MHKYIIEGGKRLAGSIKVSGSKNASLKALVAACLTEEEVVINNIPLISDFLNMAEIIKFLGGTVKIIDHSAHVSIKNFSNNLIPLDMASHARASIMFIAPLLLRTGKAKIPNPGGCRLGARPVDRIISGLTEMGVDIKYNSSDGYFYAETEGMTGTDYEFKKNTHTGTETMIIAAVLASGQTVLRNAAEEPEIDDLINLLNNMGADVRREDDRKIIINGVKKLHGANIEVSPDRNEVVTFAIAALVTKGDIFIEDAHKVDLDAFLEKLKDVGAGYEVKQNGIRFFYKENMKSVNVETDIYPGFMTDWQAPWSVLMTQTEGQSLVHETVFENKLSYVNDLKKMGARMTLFNPKVPDPKKVYNFNIDDDKPEYFHAVEIIGPTDLHNAVVTMQDIRAGAAIVLAALAAKGESVIHNIYLVGRGYEKFHDRLNMLGASIRVFNE